MTKENKCLIKNNTYEKKEIINHVWLTRTRVVLKHLFWFSQGDYSCKQINFEENDTLKYIKIPCAMGYLC